MHQQFPRNYTWEISWGQLPGKGVFQGNSPEVNLPGGSYTGSNSLEDNLPGGNVLGQFSGRQPSRRQFVGGGESHVVESIELRLSVKCFNETDFHASLLAH